MRILLLLSLALAAPTFAAQPHNTTCPNISKTKVLSKVSGIWAHVLPEQAITFTGASISNPGGDRFYCHYKIGSLNYSGYTVNTKYGISCVPASGFKISSSGAYCTQSNPSKCNATCTY